MSDGFNHIHNAAELLADHETQVKKRVRDAAHQFWAAARHTEEWPWELRSHADAICQRIFSRVAIDATVARMGEEVAEDMAEELLLFARKADSLM
jgi:hypothetical protein